MQYTGQKGYRDHMNINFSTMTDEERTAAFAGMNAEALAAAIADLRGQASTLFALDAPSIEQAEQAISLSADVDLAEAEQARRDAVARETGERFAAARASFNNEVADEGDGDEGDEGDEDGDEPADEGDGADENGAAEDGDEGDGSEGDGEDGDGEGVVTASADASRSQAIKTSAKGSVARRVGRKTKRPAVKSGSQVVITAAADVPGVATGSVLDDMEAVTKALLGRVKGFAKYNAQAARQAHSQSGGEPVLNKFGVASFGTEFSADLRAHPNSSVDDYKVVKTALAKSGEVLVASVGANPDPTLTAAGWCAPSENVYSFIADYVVDGLVTVPEVNAPRGGLNLTTGPERSSQGQALDDFGFVQTEAQAEAGEVKTCETIVCPDFEDHRLDAIGYCYKIPLLTQKAYPELITDALRYASVLYAHKVNARVLSDMVDLSDPISTQALGATFTDTLEALAVIATRRRRKWNIGENAVMEVKVPVIAREIFRADMSRRTGLALSDVATDQKIAAEFSARRLAVQYVADWQEQPDDDLAGILPNEIQALIYPAGTFIKAVEDVINLSAVYDAASLSINEYTGVFFEQGILVAKAGYGSDLVTIPVCTGGTTGAQTLDCTLPFGSL